MRKHNFPVKFLASYRWLLRHHKQEDGELLVETDNIYFQDGSNDLNQQGLAYFHLLLANELQFHRIKYRWNGMPVVEKKAISQARKVLPMGHGMKALGLGGGVGGRKSLQKGFGKRRVSAPV